MEVARAPRQFDCKTCAARHCDEHGELPGSIGPAPMPRYEIDGVIQSNTCFLPMVSQFSRECLRLYGHYKNGLLIESGGLYDQPNVYIEAMGLIDGHIKA